MDVEFHNEHSQGSFQNGDAIFALATVAGKSAIAVFRCSGPEVWQSLRHNFSRYNALERAMGHSAVYGLLHAKQEMQEMIDEVLLLKFCAPRSYTGEDMLEIQCHGSIAVLQCIRDLLLELGLREAQRGEFTYRSIRCGKRDLYQAETLALLADSKTQNQRRSALKNFGSSPHAQKLHELRQELLQVLARTELQLDYDETELEFSYALPDSLPLAQKCLTYLRDSLSTFQLQQSHWQPKKIVLVGATNSGKSSLFNRLLSSERSIVSERAGTTRDYLEAQLEFDGHAIQLYDTAGLHEDPADSVEQEGIKRTWQLLEQANFLVLVSDIRTITPQYDLHKLVNDKHIPLFEVWNKCDLVQELPQNTEQGLFICSALSGAGLPELIEALRHKLPDLSNDLHPVNERQAELLREACALLEEYCAEIKPKAKPKAKSKAEPLNWGCDWACELLRQICGRLGEATGEESNIQMLREIFEQFCVGK